MRVGKRIIETCNDVLGWVKKHEGGTGVMKKVECEGENESGT